MKVMIQTIIKQYFTQWNVKREEKLQRVNYSGLVQSQLLF